MFGLRSARFSGYGIEVSILRPGMVAARLFDSERTRRDRYGGAAIVDAEAAQRIIAFMDEQARTPAETAWPCLEGLEARRFHDCHRPAHPHLYRAALDRADALPALS